MSGRDEATQIFDHMAKADGQHIRCQRAAFIAPSGIPVRVIDRIELGMHIGFGLTFGVSIGAAVVTVITKLLKALFA